MPLTGVRVLDLSRVLSGPFCTMLLGDLGADVIKVEAPEGDPVRHQGAQRDGLSWYFAAFNRNKRSLRLDLRQPQGREVLARLVERADVLVENFRPGVMQRLGLGFDDLRQLRTDGVAKGDVGHNAFAKKGADALLGAVKELVGYDELGRLVLFFQ